jgi:hypothetical protein
VENTIDLLMFRNEDLYSAALYDLGNFIRRYQVLKPWTMCPVYKPDYEQVRAPVTVISVPRIPTLKGGSLSGSDEKWEFLTPSHTRCEK